MYILDTLEPTIVWQVVALASRENQQEPDKVKKL